MIQKNSKHNRFNNSMFPYLNENIDICIRNDDPLSIQAPYIPSLSPSKVSLPFPSCRYRKSRSKSHLSPDPIPHSPQVTAKAPTSQSSPSTHPTSPHQSTVPSHTRVPPRHPLPFPRSNKVHPKVHPKFPVFYLNDICCLVYD